MAALMQPKSSSIPQCNRTPSNSSGIRLSFTGLFNNSGILSFFSRGRRNSVTSNDRRSQSQQPAKSYSIFRTRSHPSNISSLAGVTKVEAEPKSDSQNEKPPRAPKKKSVFHFETSENECDSPQSSSSKPGINPRSLRKKNPSNSPFPSHMRSASVSSVKSSTHSGLQIDFFGEPLRRYETIDVRPTYHRRRKRGFNPRRTKVVGIGNPVTSPASDPKRPSFFWIDDDDDDIDVEDEDESDYEETPPISSRPSEIFLPVPINTKKQFSSTSLASLKITRISKGVECNQVKILMDPKWNISQKLMQKSLIAKILQYDDPHSELEFKYSLLPCDSCFLEQDDRHLFLKLQEIGVGTENIFEKLTLEMETFWKENEDEKKISVDEIKERCEYLMNVISLEERN